MEFNIVYSLLRKLSLAAWSAWPACLGMDFLALCVALSTNGARHFDCRLPTIVQHAKLGLVEPNWPNLTPAANRHPLPPHCGAIIRGIAQSLHCTSIEIDVYWNILFFLFNSNAMQMRCTGGGHIHPKPTSQPTCYYMHVPVGFHHNPIQYINATSKNWFKYIYMYKLICCGWQRKESLLADSIAPITGPI